MPNIIQFIHPGPEHGMDDLLDGRLHKNWNSDNHRRKFCRAKGRYVDIDNKNKKGEFMFWGEWEPPSFVEYTHQKFPSPKYLHSPYLPSDRDGNVIITGKSQQNTDPCVFGDCFKYFICQQIRKNGRLTQMASLENGDLILFGSCKSKRFLIDTVFVVDNVIELARIESEYKITSIDRCDNYASTGCKIYKGRAYQEGDIYSFTPASKDYFGRMSIPAGKKLLLNDYITNSLTQGRKVSIVGEETIQTVWHELKSLTQELGLFLAHQVDWPKKYSSIR